MKHILTDKIANISFSELVAGAFALMLLGASVTAVSQTTNGTQAQTPSTSPAARAVKEARVLADPATKMYMLCRSDEDQKATDDSSSDYKPNPKAVTMSEDEAKAKGFKASAHKAPCP